MIAEFFAFIVTVIIFLLPGLLLAFAFLKGVGLSRFEKFFIGLLLAITANPLLSALEFTLFGVRFSAALVWANALLLFATGLFLLYRQGQLSMPQMPDLSREHLKHLAKKNLVFIILLFFILSAFYVRFATAWATNFFEFDPYYYDRVAEMVVRNGFAPAVSDDVYFAIDNLATVASYRVAPIIPYLTASLYSVFSGVLGIAYDKNLLILTAQLYPPLVAALMAFFGFLFLREEYSDYVALTGAGLLAFTPQLVVKMSAGVSELQPWGIFGAMLLFACYTLAAHRKSLRLALLASFALFVNILGSEIYIWPVLVLAAFIALQSFVDYLAGELDERSILINAVVAAGGLAGNVLLLFYRVSNPLALSNGTLLLIASLVPGVLLFYSQKIPQLKSVGRRDAALVIAFLLLLAGFATPLGARVLNYVGYTAGFAVTHIPLMNTVQEENPTTPAFFASSYGYLNPPFLLVAATLMTAALAVVVLLRKGRKDYAVASALLALVVVVFNAQIDSLATALFGSTENSAIASFVLFITKSDVFLYMALAMLFTIITYLYSEDKNKLVLLVVLAVYPIAFIGLNKLKYMVHLAFALCIAAPFLIGELSRLLKELNGLLKLLDENTLKHATLWMIVIIGALAVFMQATTVNSSMQSLSYTRISQDWMDSMTWMRTNLPEDARILSWWDYGHWTTFFAERKSVLDPGNAVPDYDQEVAHAFVNGDTAEFVSVLKRHAATHVLVDADLISKWGALVYLSGACDASMAKTCPEKPAIENWQSGAGKSKYEAEHYFEYLNLVGNCPQSASPVALPALQSSFGAVYCVGEKELFLLSASSSLNASYKRPYTIAGRDQFSEVFQNTSYFFPISQTQILNVNPDLTPIGLKSNVINAAFTRLFFFEQLDGFKLVYRSQNGQVKIFEYAGG